MMTELLEKMEKLYKQSSDKEYTIYDMLEARYQAAVDADAPKSVLLRIMAQQAELVEND